MRIQRRDALGEWRTVADADVAGLLERSQRYNAGLNVSAALQAGSEVRYSPEDWYPYIRAAREPQPRPLMTVVRCSCGHDAPPTQIMSTSRGSSCPGCYDKMSD